MSRHPSSELLEIHEIEVESPLAISSSKLKEYQDATQIDHALNTMKRFCKTGFSADKAMWPEDTKQYWSIRVELNTRVGVCLRGNRIIVPKEKRRKVLHQLHRAHCGTEKMKRKARNAVYWPQISAQIEEFVASCALCEKFRKSNRKM